MNENTIVALLFILPVLMIILHSQAFFKKRYVMKTTQLLFCLVMLTLSLSLLITSKKLLVIHVANWPAPYGITLAFDGLVKLMLVVFLYIFTCNTLFSFKDETLLHQNHFFYQGSCLLILGVIGALSTYDIFNLYVWSEIMLVSAFILLGFYKKNNLKHMYHYALFNILGTLFLLLSIALIYGITGHLNYAAISKNLSENYDYLTIIACTLLLFGLSIKGAFFPFYFWLPGAYSSTSFSSTLIISSLITKVIMVVILHLVWLWLPLKSDIIVITFVTISLFTMLFGVFGAASHNNIKKILTFHIISQLGYVLLAIFVNSSLAIIGAIYFLIHNIFIKNSLIMTACIIKEKYNTNNLNKLGNIISDHPLLAVLFFISAMSLAGFPPLSGFWGKFLILKSTFDAHYYLPFLIAILVSSLTLYSMLKIWRYAYCEKTPSSTEEYSQCKLDKTQLLTLIAVILIPIFIGFFPNPIILKLKSAANEIQNSPSTANLILRDFK